jgi:hypothetical protein
MAAQPPARDPWEARNNQSRTPWFVGTFAEVAIYDEVVAWLGLGGYTEKEFQKRVLALDKSPGWQSTGQKFRGEICQEPLVGTSQIEEP